MKRFLLNLIAFILVIATAVGALQWLLVHDRDKLLRLPPGVTTIYMGNSTIECAINDTILPPSHYNFARSSELIDFVFAKLRMLKRYNPAIDTVVVGLDDIILFKDYSQPWETLYSHPYFLAEFSPSEMFTMATTSSLPWFSSYFSQTYNISKIKRILRAKNDKDLDIGGFKYIVRDKLQTDLQRRNENRSRPHSIDELNPYTLRFFKKLDSFCRDNKIKLIFLSTPKYENMHRDSAYRQFHRIYFPETPLYDYAAFELPDSCYGDCVHLNHQGAERFSAEIANGFSDSYRR